MSILYVTQNGVTDHIGRSQVAPYVLGLAREGFRIHVLSAEKSGQEALIAEYAQLFDAASVRWTRVPYRNRPALLGQIWTQHRMLRAAEKIARSEEVRIMHSRSFPPALIAHRLKPALGVKFIFDFRDFYADGGLTKAHGLSRLAFRRLKSLEGPMVRNADKIVCLTERAREILSSWYFSEEPSSRSRFQVIPCCADFEHFDPQRVTAEMIEAARARAGLPDNGVVLLYLGSLGPDYLLPEMLDLFGELLALCPDAHFLFVSNNGREMVESAARLQSIPLSRVHFVSVDRNEVPAFICLATLSVLFIRPDVSKAGCSPTKLAELFACNVPVIANAGVGDLDSILELGRNGSIAVKDFSGKTLRAALEKVLDVCSREAHPIRENSLEFTLEEGVQRYAAVYRDLLAPGQRSIPC